MDDNQKKNNFEELKNDIEQEIKKCEEEKVQAKVNLENEYQATSDELSEAAKETESEQNRFEAAKKQISTSVENLKDKTSEHAKFLEKSIKSNFTEFTIITSSIIRWFRFSILFFAAAFLGVYFWLYNQSFSEKAFFSIGGLNFNEQSAVTVGSLSVAIIALFGIVHFGSRSIKNKIEKSKAVVDHSILDIQGKRPDIPQNYLDVGNFFSGIIKRAPIFDSRMKNIVKNSREFIPIVDKLYTILERRNLQAQFRKSLKNALSMYGLFQNPSSDLITTIEEFSTPSNSELDWIGEAAPKVSLAFSGSEVTIDERIIKVVYFDYANSNYLADAWNDVLKEPELLKQFAYLLSSRTMRETISGSYGAIVKLLEKPNFVFKLSEFQRHYYDFSVDFKNRKTHMKTAASQIGLNSEEVKSSIETFVPSTLNKDEWDKELADKVCEKLDFNFRYLLLFYYNRIGFEMDGIRIWHEIRDDTNDLFSNFIKKLDSENLLRIPESYRTNLDIPTFTKISDKLPKFDFDRFNESIYLKFKAIDDVKRKTIHVLEEISPKLTTTKFRDGFSSFVPTSDDIVADIANYVNRELGLDSDIVMLFYGAKYDQNLSDEYYKKIKEEIYKLSEFLIEYELIKLEKIDEEQNVKNLSSILKQESKFNLNKIQSRYQRYSHLLEISIKMIEFLNEEKIIDTEKLEFETLITIIQNSGEGRLENIQGISYHLIKSSNSFSENSLGSIAKACSCLFLYTRGNISARSACMSVQLDPLASEILYCNMTINDDESLVTKKHPLKDTITEMFENHNKRNLEYLPVFKRGLATGYLYGSTKEMMMHKMDDVKKEMEKISEIREELEEIQDSIKTVLDTEFEEDSGFLEYAIKSQIVQAYMITTKSKGPALTQILDNGLLLQNAAKEIDPKIDLRNFLIKGTPKEKDPTLGSHTRIGVIPLEMDFADFSKKFKLIYDRAVENYIAEKKGGNKAEFSVNIFRIMTSPATFMPIRLDSVQTSQKEDTDDPIDIIQTLLNKHFSTNDKLTLVTTFNNKSSSVGIREIIEKACDKNSLYSFIRKELPTVVSDYAVIEQAINNKNFDAKLYQSYKSEKFSKLAIMIYAIKKSTNDDDRIIGTISDNVNKILREQNIDIKQEDIKQLSPLLYQKLIKFGKVLTS